MENVFSVKRFQAGYCLSYFLESDSEAILVDPHITKVQEYRDHLSKRKLELKAVVDTHTHADRTGARHRRDGRGRSCRQRGTRDKNLGA